MLRIPIHTEIDIQTLLQNTTNLSVAELETFATALNKLIKQRKQKEQKDKENQLLAKLNQAVLSKVKHEKVLELSPKVESETITTKEQKQLSKLLTEVEELRNERVKIMIELARLKSVTLPTLMQELGLKPLLRA